MARPDDDPDVEEAIEAALDADDATVYRMWRHRARGGTVGQLIAGAERRRRGVQLSMPIEEFRIVYRAALSRGLTPASYVRQCVATSLVEEHGVDAGSIPWLTRDGLLP